MAGAHDDEIVRVDNEISIRRYRDEDVEPLAKLVNNPNVWNTLSDNLPHPYSVQDSKDWIALVRSSQRQVVTGPSLEDASAPRVPFSYVITYKDEPAGTIALQFLSGVYRLSATLGYWLGEPFHSKHIMSRAVPAFVRWSWSTFGYLLRLNATAYESNLKSQKVMQKAGFEIESVRVNGCIKNGVVLNEVTLGALRPVSA